MTFQHKTSYRLNLSSPLPRCNSVCQHAPHHHIAKDLELFFFSTPSKKKKPKNSFSIYISFHYTVMSHLLTASSVCSGATVSDSRSSSLVTSCFLGMGSGASCPYKFCGMSPFIVEGKMTLMSQKKYERNPRRLKLLTLLV